MFKKLGGYIFKGAGWLRGEIGGMNGKKAAGWGAVLSGAAGALGFNPQYLRMASDLLGDLATFLGA